MLRTLTLNGQQELEFLVDTGFEGELALPKSYATIFGTSHMFFDAEYADGVKAPAMAIACQIDWLHGSRDVTAMYIDGRSPLLGMELLDSCIVTIETEGGVGSITIESV